MKYTGVHECTYYTHYFFILFFFSPRKCITWLIKILDFYLALQEALLGIHTALITVSNSLTLWIDWKSLETWSGDS